MKLDYNRAAVLRSMIVPCREMYNRAMWDKVPTAWHHSFNALRQFAIECEVVTQNEHPFNTPALYETIERRLNDMEGK